MNSVRATVIVSMTPDRKEFLRRLRGVENFNNFRPHDRNVPIPMQSGPTTIEMSEIFSPDDRLRAGFGPAREMPGCAGSLPARLSFFQKAPGTLFNQSV